MDSNHFLKMNPTVSLKSGFNSQYFQTFSIAFILEGNVGGQQRRKKKKLLYLLSNF